MNLQILKRAMRALAARRPVFHSEADFQHELAMEFSRAGFDLRLEVPFSVNLNGHQVAVELDLLLIDRQTKQKAAVEIKYVKSAASIVHNGENFDLKHTWAPIFPVSTAWRIFSASVGLRRQGRWISAFQFSSPMPRRLGIVMPEMTG